MPLIIGAKSATATGYAVDNSCRFNSPDTPYLNYTPSAGDRDKFTFSCWVKRGLLAANQCLFGVLSGGNYSEMYFATGGTIMWDEYPGSMVGRLETNRLFRDCSAWYHLVFVYDSANATAGDRMRLYVNGVEETSFSTETQPDQYQDSYFNSNVVHYVAKVSTEYFDGYMAEVCFIEGSALTPTSFGEFDEDSPTIWKPIDVSELTFGTNGFYLNFEDSADLGVDVSGNSNDLTEVNLDATDQATDTPTNNFCTMNPIVGLQGNPSYTLFSQGNTIVEECAAGTTNEWRAYYGTMGVSSGKWYWEVECTSAWGATICQRHGICDVNQLVQQEDESSTDLSRAWGWRNPGGYRNNNTDTDDSSYGSYTTGDILQFALDLDNNKLYFGKDGTWEDSGDPTSGATGTGAVSITTGYTYTPLDERLYGSDNFSANFGNPSFTVSSGNADGNGYGNFEYAPPSGYYALCTKNLGAYGG